MQVLDAGVAELADAQDLKSCGWRHLYRFDSRCQAFSDFEYGVAKIKLVNTGNTGNILQCYMLQDIFLITVSKVMSPHHACMYVET